MEGDGSAINLNAQIQYRYKNVNINPTPTYQNLVSEKTEIPISLDNNIFNKDIKANERKLMMNLQNSEINPNSLINQLTYEDRSCLNIQPISTPLVSPAPLNVIQSRQVSPQVMLCQSIVGSCMKMALKNYNYCYKHILEDSNSPFQQCSFVSFADQKHCPNPAPKLLIDKLEKPSYCVLHIKDQSLKTKNKKKKKKKEQSITKNTEVNNPRKRPSSLSINSADSAIPKQSKQDSSSDEEDYSFFTDTVHLKKTECTWLGNQASDADSTDSEDENSLNHAGTWTVEEALKICKDKMSRLRSLYSQQFKRMHHYLKEERRKIANDNDMEPFVVSKVPFYKHSDDSYNDYLKDIHLSNYQRHGTEEIVAEKMMKEKRSRGSTLNSRRTDLPKCHFTTEGVRCTSRVLPFSKFCLNHILQDPDQYLYSPCSSNENECTKPGDILNTSCNQHINLMEKATEKCWENFLSSKKTREIRKKKADVEIDKDTLKPTRVSARLHTRKSSENSPVASFLDDSTSETSSHETRSLQDTTFSKVLKVDIETVAKLNVPPSEIPIKNVPIKTITKLSSPISLSAYANAIPEICSNSSKTYFPIEETISPSTPSTVLKSDSDVALNSSITTHPIEKNLNEEDISKKSLISEKTNLQTKSPNFSIENETQIKETSSFPSQSPSSINTIRKDLTAEQIKADVTTTENEDLKNTDASELINFISKQNLSVMQNIPSLLTTPPNKTTNLTSTNITTTNITTTNLTASNLTPTVEENQVQAIANNLLNTNDNLVLVEESKKVSNGLVNVENSKS